ncbi:hypothetical protein CRM22_008199 [Opisthorchis felineus]|uniref:Large ribosomal subunit protein mL38 n=1 Tax=Opisthorchis felineus TaxID=147828 RepID=A0A4V3SDK4_OPIFE|nr:hypothetical protein CRM22_008199 [Opisthorchis felineus]
MPSWRPLSTKRSFLLFLCFRNHSYRRGFLPPDVEPGQYPFPKRQVPSCGRLSFSERMTELNKKPLSLETLEPVDIGLPFSAPPLSSQRFHSKRPDLEPAARKRQLTVPIDSVHSALEDTQAPLRRLSAARHFDIFNALFGPPHFFVPQINFDVYYPHFAADVQPSSGSAAPESISVVPVFSGNLITPKSGMVPPLIDLSATPTDHLWTLIMSCPDEPIGGDDGSDAANEYIHWMVTNLQVCGKDEPAEGDEIVPYLPPLPYVGTGYHRYVFILYRQDNGRVDFTPLKREKAVGDLRTQRQFSTLEFYRQYESQLTPGGLSFFQSSWDPSVRDYYRTVLDVSEPIFEIEWPSPRVPPQERFPLANSWNKARRHPHGLPLIRERYGVHNDVSFDVYLDRYRDRKELAEELVRERLQIEGNPLDPNDPRRKQVEYPAAVPLPEGMPSWWVRQEMQRRLRKGRWKHLEGHDG